jgi:hypothetical protein
MEGRFKMQAAGSFDVKITPQQHEEGVGDPHVARMDIDKKFHGDLEGTSKGQMLASGNPASGSGGYVAMEYVTGALQGRSGSFALQHIGTMKRGDSFLTVSVVPDSGTGDLSGLEGKMSIVIEGGKHLYEFEFALPESD